MPTHACAWEKCGFLFRILRREGRYVLSFLSPFQRRAWREWVREQGPAFVSGLGIGAGDTVLDFGCGRGAYTLPAALRVGPRGRVIAIDAEARPLRVLARTARRWHLNNIHLARDLAQARPVLESHPCRVILLYDMLHIVPREQRQGLYETLRDWLEPNGVVSVHPAHLKNNEPLRHFQDLTEDDIVREIQAARFRLKESRATLLWHGHRRVRGRVLNFEKG